MFEDDPRYKHIQENKGRDEPPVLLKVVDEGDLECCKDAKNKAKDDPKEKVG